MRKLIGFLLACVLLFACKKETLKEPVTVPVIKPLKYPDASVKTDTTDDGEGNGGPIKP